ncbi:RadC family protein [Alkalimarinus alittae]|uniref:DNA repair protein RadC n=1 Tax=Alkalimarinus alittae TaxID=2961619 RepID=A0ABY6N0U9_9ALTE|nr:DNA repair protein RadC [Alkalimarinus alittae]UZE95728.1 DNA repair protein RadC [Alkalimarinus alittae]
MAISDWPVNERPREKLLDKGPHALSDAELLAIFLRTGIPGKTAVDLSRELLVRFGSLRAMFSSSLEEFCSAPGLGSAKYTQLQATLEMAKRHMQEQLQHESALTSPTLTRNYLKSKLIGRPYEVFCCLYLDNQHRVIKFEELFRGTIDGASVYPREVVKNTLDNQAAAIIFAHNHPSGVAEPSIADQQITKRLVSALALIDVRVLDHIIIGNGETTSFAERGLL